MSHNETLEAIEAQLALHVLAGEDYASAWENACVDVLSEAIHNAHLVSDGISPSRLAELPRVVVFQNKSVRIEWPSVCTPREYRWWKCADLYRPPRSPYGVQLFDDRRRMGRAIAKWLAIEAGWKADNVAGIITAIKRIMSALTSKGGGK